MLLLCCINQPLFSLLVLSSSIYFFSFLLWFLFINLFYYIKWLRLFNWEWNIFESSQLFKQEERNLFTKKKIKKVLQRQGFATSPRGVREGQSEHQKWVKKLSDHDEDDCGWKTAQNDFSLGLFSHWTLRLNLRRKKTPAGEDCYLISRRRKLLPYSSWWRLILFFRVLFVL